jgi:hypothetical protein
MQEIRRHSFAVARLCQALSIAIGFCEHEKEIGRVVELLSGRFGQ